MTATKLHLILNYYPAIAMVIAALLLAGGYWRRSDRLKSAAMKLMIATAIFTFAVYITGEIAGAQGGYTGAAAEGLARHKNLARPAFLLIEVTGIAAIAGLILMRRSPGKGRLVTLATLVLSIVTSGVTLTTVYFGRQVKWSVMPPPDRTMTTTNDREKQIWHV